MTVLRRQRIVLASATLTLGSCLAIACGDEFVAGGAPSTTAEAGGVPGEESGSFFKGALDEIAVYPRALGAKVVRRHFAFGK